MHHENQVLNVKLKEKEQELRLNELKVKELRKQLPHRRINPLHGKRKTIDSGIIGNNLLSSGHMMQQKIIHLP